LYRIWNLKFEFELEFNWFDWGLTSLADVAASYRLVPIRLEASNLSCQILIEGIGKKRCGGDSPARQAGEVTALVVDGGTISMMNGGEEVADGVQQRTAASNP
jgi:hypothetical protein